MAKRRYRKYTDKQRAAYWKRKYLECDKEFTALLRDMKQW